MEVLRVKKLCAYCNELLTSERDALEHARKHARKFYNPRFCSFDEAVRHAFAAIWLHSKDP